MLAFWKEIKCCTSQKFNFLQRNKSILQLYNGFKWCTHTNNELGQPEPYGGVQKVQTACSGALKEKEQVTYQ
jgi:hypothetical protein